MTYAETVCVVNVAFHARAEALVRQKEGRFPRNVAILVGLVM